MAESCNGPPKLNCTGKATFEPGKRTIIFFVKNELGREISLTNLISYDEEEPWFCMTRFVVESVDVSIEGSELVNINTYPKINDRGIVKFIITYSGPDKDYIDQKFALDYTNDEDYEGYFLITTLKN